MRVSLDQMRQNVADELYILTLFEVSPRAVSTLKRRTEHRLAPVSSFSLSKMCTKW